jgi:HD-GYP domain-containing protein (c-di-GMP phosphodiesterase class II)
MDLGHVCHDGVLGQGSPDDESGHSEMGARILAQGGFGPDVPRSVRHHHERWDGHGYPDRLAGERIPIGSRIVAVADAFEALTAGRADGKPMTPPVAIEALEQESGRAFDPRLVKVLRDLIEDRHLAFRMPGLSWPVVA